jgi:pimeloyl-ACP methyl ester carboxylesterase
MATFVLIHGGWAGGWVWENVVPRLEAHGHRVEAPDLPAHGDDATPASEVTLDSYVRRVVEIVDAQPEPVVLVGHSSGGVIITQAAEERPERIGVLVYTCAYLPAGGQTLLELGQTDPDQLILPNLEFAPDGATAMVREDAVRAALFADCSDADYERYTARITPEPLAAAATPVKVTSERYGSVPRAYVQCQDDRGISIGLQQRMCAATPCHDVVSLATGHMPMYAAPDALVAHLVAFAGTSFEPGGASTGTRVQKLDTRFIDSESDF